MSDVHLEDFNIPLCGELPKVGVAAPDFIVTASDLMPVDLSDFNEKALLINVFPSIDTKVCFSSVNRFSSTIGKNQQFQLLCISMDLPYALQRVQAQEGLEDIVLLSDYKTRNFGSAYGLTMVDGPLAGLLARAVIVLDKNHIIRYTELVTDLSNEPNYAEAIKNITTLL